MRLVVDSLQLKIAQRPFKLFPLPHSPHPSTIIEITHPLFFSMSQLTLNLVEGSVSFGFSLEAAQDLKSALMQLMESLKATATTTAPGSKAAAREPIEYRHTGDVFLEIFCNPNIWASPFAAKVLVTLRDDRIRLSTEAELTRVVEDVNHYLEANS